MRIFSKNLFLLPMSHATAGNPLADLMSNEAFEVLKNNNLLNKRGIRNYRMRRHFDRLRGMKVPARDAIEQLQETHGSLKYDTVRKIVYGVIE